MKKFQYIVVLLFVIVLGTGCSNDEKQENFLSETENEIEPPYYRFSMILS